MSFIFNILVLKEKIKRQNRVLCLAPWKIGLSFLFSCCHTMEAIWLSWASIRRFIAISYTRVSNWHQWWRMWAYKFTATCTHSCHFYLLWPAMIQSHLDNRWHHSTKKAHSPKNSNWLCCHLPAVSRYQYGTGKGNAVGQVKLWRASSSWL